MNGVGALAGTMGLARGKAADLYERNVKPALRLAYLLTVRHRPANPARRVGVRRRLPFPDVSVPRGGRFFEVHVAWGPNASAQTQRDAADLITSLDA